MNDMSLQREKMSLKQLAAVSSARRSRLRAERQLLFERERSLAEAMELQSADEALLAQQRNAWSGRWRAWVQAGGALRSATSLQRDRGLLADMAEVLRRRRTALQVQSEQLMRDLGAWAGLRRAAEVFDESMADRGRALKSSLERGAERQRDEEALVSHVAAVAASSAATVS